MGGELTVTSLKRQTLTNASEAALNALQMFTSWRGMLINWSATSGGIIVLSSDLARCLDVSISVKRFFKSRDLSFSWKYIVSSFEKFRVFKKFSFLIIFQMLFKLFFKKVFQKIFIVVFQPSKFTHALKKSLQEPRMVHYHNKWPYRGGIENISPLTLTVSRKNWGIAFYIEDHAANFIYVFFDKNLWFFR